MLGSVPVWKGGQCTQPGVTGPNGGLCLVHSLTLIIFLPQLWSSLGLVSRFYLLVPPPQNCIANGGTSVVAGGRASKKTLPQRLLSTRRERLKCFSGRKGNFSSFRAGSDGVLLLESAAGIGSRAAKDLSNPVDPHLRQESAHRRGRGLGGIC